MGDSGTDQPAIGRIRNIVTSMSLIIVTLIIGTACVVALAATLTQARVSSISVDGVPVSIWKLDGLRKEWAAIKRQQQQRADELAAAEKEMDALRGQIRVLREKNNSALAEILNAFTDIEARVQGVDPALAVALAQDTDVESRLARVQSSQANLRSNTVLGLAIILDTLDRSRAEYRTSGNDIIVANTRTNSIIERMDALTKAQAGSNKNLDAIFSRIREQPLDQATRTHVENAFYELNPSSDGNSLLNGLITLHPDVLALSLVLLMGMLGSSLQMLHAFFRDHKVEPLGGYFLRVSVGAITALVIFIVAKAGVPVVTDASRLSGDAPINPYFVSFLAIISGLLSERAIVAVQNQGERFFGTSTSEPDRWARADLRPQLTTQGLSTKTLAHYLDRTEEDATAIAKGDQKATFDQQRAIAIYLRGEIRDLFTDIAPSEAAAG
jgi:hypothetical protein